MKKRIMGVLTAVAMLISMTGIPAYASDQTFTTDTTANVPISATVSSSYTVVLPSVTQTLSDDDNDGKYTGTVLFDAYGKINSDKALVVIAGDDAHLSFIQEMIDANIYQGKTSITTFFHMTGTATGQTVTGDVKQTALRFLARNVSTESALDRNIPAAASDPASFEVQLEVSIPYTDTFSGNLPFTFGLASK